MADRVERDYDAEMRLPEGKTCDQCHHFTRCKSMFGAHDKRTQCDFHPSRFAARQQGDA